MSHYTHHQPTTTSNHHLAPVSHHRTPTHTTSTVHHQPTHTSSTVRHQPTVTHHQPTRTSSSNLHSQSQVLPQDPVYQVRHRTIVSNQHEFKTADTHLLRSGITPEHGHSKVHGITRVNKPADYDSSSYGALYRYDADFKGYLNRENIRSACHDLGVEIATEAQLDNVFNEIDTDRDGKVTAKEFQEFYNYCTSDYFKNLSRREGAPGHVLAHHGNAVNH